MTKSGRFRVKVPNGPVTSTALFETTFSRVFFVTGGRSKKRRLTSAGTESADAPILDCVEDVVENGEAVFGEGEEKAGMRNEGRAAAVRFVDRSTGRKHVCESAADIVKLLSRVGRHRRIGRLVIQDVFDRCAVDSCGRVMIRRFAKIQTQLVLL